MADPTVPFTTKRPENEPERRAWVRLGSEQEVCCLPATPSIGAESETAWLAIVQDVSAGGIGLLVRQRFEPGTLLILELSARFDEVTRPLPVRVVHAAQEGKRFWTIGCAFASTLSPEELQKFVAERSFCGR
jgi:hypothetical protein